MSGNCSTVQAQGGLGSSTECSVTDGHVIIKRIAIGSEGCCWRVSVAAQQAVSVTGENRNSGGGGGLMLHPVWKAGGANLGVFPLSTSETHRGKDAG